MEIIQNTMVNSFLNGEYNCDSAALAMKILRAVGNYTTVA
jgi:hypothetical protein